MPLWGKSPPIFSRTGLPNDAPRLLSVLELSTHNQTIAAAFFQGLDASRAQKHAVYAEETGCGADRNRTCDPHNAIVVLYQLSYDPIRISQNFRRMRRFVKANCPQNSPRHRRRRGSIDSEKHSRRRQKNLVSPALSSSFVRRRGGGARMCPDRRRWIFFIHAPAPTI
jgi:hypothetical protein